jgi:hypothetical protein
VKYLDFFSARWVSLYIGTDVKCSVKIPEAKTLKEITSDLAKLVYIKGFH